jgi:hypothetical protein
MTEPYSSIRADLGPDASDDLVRLAERLLDERPLPGPGFRGELRRHLESRSRKLRPRATVRRLIAGYAASGTALMVIGAVSAAGGGPLGH